MRNISPLLVQPFRLMFMGAALVASVGIAMWSIFLHLGLLATATLPPILWHGHVMLFGFASALVGGFLLTAVANWTGLPTTTPLRLLALTTLWLCARLSFLMPHVPYAVAATLDSAYYPLLAVFVGVPIIQKRDYKHLAVIVVLLGLAIFGILFHLSVVGVLSLSPNAILAWVIDLLTVMMLLVGGMIIPFFTERRVEGLQINRSWWIERAVGPVAALLVVLDIAMPGSIVLAIGSLFLAALVLVRLYGWRPWKVRREPMLWILHLGYLWIAAGLVMRGISILTGLFPEITALHAITTGALGSLAIGMMTRVLLGHTGRALVAGKAMSVAFVLVNVAALLRVGAPALLPAAGLLWGTAFAIYFVRFLPIHFGVLRARNG